MQGLILVRDAMVTDVKTATIDTTIREAVEKMTKFRIGSIIVVDQGKPVGIVTQGDILKKVVGGGLDATTVRVREIMSTPLHTINENVPIEEAARMMTKWNVKRLPVIRDGKLRGIVTQTDLIRSTPMLVGLLQEFVRTRYVPPELRAKS